MDTNYKSIHNFIISTDVNCSKFVEHEKTTYIFLSGIRLLGSILFDVGELRQHLFCIKKYRKDTLKSFRINLATNS